MEAALLEGESSRSSSSPRRRDDRTGVFLRRSDAIAYGSPYQKAAALVDLVCFPPFFLRFDVYFICSCREMFLSLRLQGDIV